MTLGGAVSRRLAPDSVSRGSGRQTAERHVISRTSPEGRNSRSCMSHVHHFPMLTFGA